MKRYIINGIIGLAVMFASSACNDWLDVSPKLQIEEEKHFDREGGFQDQITGVYSRMASTSMYGLQMGIGFTEVLSQNYNVDANSTTWRYAADYDYTNSNCESIINSIWNQAYSCIANLNILLRNIDRVDRNMFTNNHYYLYKGEALGLRAFLHFEMMRLFACAPAMDRGAKGVPYVTEYSTQVVGQKTVGETIELIIKDLLEARNYLAQDSLKSGSSPYNWRSSRIPYFNYYAAVGTLARAYLWNEDKQNALTYAQEIVDVTEGESRSYPFDWIHYSSAGTEYVFRSEHLFHMLLNDWEDISDAYLKASAGVNVLSPTEDKADEIYERTSKGLGNDYRMLNNYEQDGERKYCSKFWYRTGGDNGIFPLIRMTEAFYIAAECLKDSDPEEAVRLLNAVRENRNLSLYPLDDNLTADQIQEEIYKEYRKEFVGEGGQLFYYHKRRNDATIKGSAKTMSKATYVLPIPSTDVEFGGYTN